MTTPSSRAMTFLSLLCLLAPLAGADELEEQLPFDVFVVPPQPISGLDISWDDLFGELAWTPTVSHLHGPFHGSLTPTPTGFHYIPSLSLWEAKVDSFVFDYEDAGKRFSVNVVIAVGQAHKGDSVRNTFDDLSPGDADWSIQDPTGVIDVSDSALQVDGDASGEGYVFYVVDDEHVKLPSADLYDGVRSHSDSSTTGTGSGILLRPPARESLDYPAPGVDDAGQVLYAAGPEGSADSIKVRVRRTLEGLQARIEAFDEALFPHHGSWVNLPADHPFKLALEYDYLPHSQEIARLRIDDDVATTLTGFEGGSLPLHLDEQRIGVMEPDRDSIALEIEEVEVYRYRIHAEEEPEHTDDFEDGGFHGWNVPFGSSLRLAERGVAGGLWLEADLASSDTFLVDSNPVAASQVRLRFDLDSTALVDQTVKTVVVHGADAFSGDNAHLKVFVRRTPNAAAQLKVSIKGEVWHSTGWQTLQESQANRVELRFQAASMPDVADGLLRVWLDGVELPMIGSVANAQNRVETVRFGAISVDGSQTGRIYLDNYQLWIPHGANP